MRSITLLANARQDLDDIVEYLSQFQESIALNQYDGIIDTIRLLRHFPEMGRLYEPGNYRFPYRQVVVDDYLVFYVDLDHSIEIHRVLHSKRDIGRHVGQDRIDEGPDSF